MRDDALPEVMDDQVETRRQENAQMLAAQVREHRHPEFATLLLKHKCVVKPRSIYRQNEDGQDVYPRSHPSVEYCAKTLCVPIFKIPSMHVQAINSVILNKAYDLSEIVYKKKCALLFALDYFLRMPSEGFYSLKNYPSETDARVTYIKKLERFAHTQGLDTKAINALSTTYPLSVSDHVDRPYD